MRLYGFHPVREALRHRPHEVAAVFVGRRRGGGRRVEVEGLCARHGVTLREVEERELAAPARVHNGFAAELLGSPAAASPGGDPDLLVLVEDVQDPRNLGALLRVCEGVGVGRVLVRDRGSAPLSPAVAKTSAGASEWVEIERITNTAQTAQRLQAEGYWVYGADVAGEPPWTVDLKGKILFCFGGEQKGLRPHTRQICDRLIGLPMRGRVESLNLASAAAAVLYEALRQRS